MENRYLLSTRWLQAFNAYLDYRIQHLDKMAPEELVGICRTLIRAPFKIWVLFVWFVRMAPIASVAGAQEAIPVEHRCNYAAHSSDEEQDIRRQLKSTIDYKLSRIRDCGLDPAIALAIRMRRLVCSRRNMLRIPFEAAKSILSARSRNREAGGNGHDGRGINTSLASRYGGQRAPSAVGVVGPEWLTAMFAYEGIPALGKLQSPPGAVVICVGGDSLSDPGSDALRAIRASADVCKICWHYGEKLDGGHVETARSCDYVFAADRTVAGELESACNRSVENLPPAVQPRIHNPVGWWGQPRHADEFSEHNERSIPRPWRRLIQTARGCIDSQTQGAGLTRGWMDREMLSATKRYMASRRVLTGKTMGIRIGELARFCRLNLPAETDPLLSFLVPTKRPANIDHVFETVARQSYKNCELILVLHGAGFDKSHISRKFDELQVRGTYIRVPETRSLGECLQGGADRCEGPIIGRMDDDNIYGESYASDLLMTLGCSDAAVVGKETCFRYFEGSGIMGISNGLEYAYTSKWVGGATLTFKRQVLDEVSWRPLGSGEDVAFCQDCFDKAIPVLAGSRFNFVSVRREKGDHTWQASKEWFDKELRYFPSTAVPGDVLL